MSFELFVAIRYLLARRRQAFISLISLISMIGVSVGVMALVISLALMTGLQGELRDRLLGSTAHIYVWKTTGIQNYSEEVESLNQFDNVIGAAPAVLGRGLVSNSLGERFITIKGIDPLLEGKVTDISRSIIRGSIEALSSDSEEATPGILVGHSLAVELGVDLNDVLTLVTPTGTLSPMGMMPRMRTVQIVGIYDLGLYEFDVAYGFIALDVAKRLMGVETIDFIQLRVEDIYQAPIVSEQITAQLGVNYVAQDWAQMNQALFSALGLEKLAISITIGLIVIVAALNIIASLILLVMEKSRDIAILKTMGTSSRRIMHIFMLQGLLIGLTGTFIGATFGYVIARVADYFKLVQIPSDIYQVSHVPFVVQPLDLVVVIVLAVTICFLATIYPSRQASRLDPVQALRFE